MLYAVYRVGKKVRWKSLKTQDIAVARERANIGIRFKHQAEKVIRSVAEAYDIDFSSPPLNPSPPAAKVPAQAVPKPRPANVAPCTLSEAWESWKRTWAIAEGTRETREAHRRMLGRVLKPDTALEDLTIPRLREVQAALKADGLSPVSVNDVLFKSLRRCLEHAVESGWLPENPTQKLKPLRKQQVIRQQPTWEEAWKLVEEAIQMAPESGEILRFMLAFGVGQKEVKNLKGHHIDFQRGEVNFLRQKTGKAFQVPIAPHAKPVLEALKAAGRIQTGKPVPRHTGSKGKPGWGAAVSAPRRTASERELSASVSSRLDSNKGNSQEIGPDAPTKTDGEVRRCAREPGPTWPMWQLPE